MHFLFLLHNNKVPPPKFITARHVGEVFTRLGYKAETGKHVFAVLYAALQKRTDLVRSSVESGASETSGSREGERGIRVRMG